MKVPFPTFEYEQVLWNKGYPFVIGMDEVGRGAFAGPVVVAGVVFEKGTVCSGNILTQVHDSKLLTPKKREYLSEELKKTCQTFRIAQVPVSVINKVGIGKATHMAFRNVLMQMLRYFREQPCHALVDGRAVPYLRGVGRKNQTAIIKGDRLSLSIAAASIIAKVYRDTLMARQHKKYLIYNFLSNKGYGTKHHRQMIKEYGVSKFHRTAFCD